MGNPRQRAKKREAKAAAQAAAEKAQQAAKAKAAAPCPKATPEEADAARVSKEYDKIAQNGHAVQRHGEAITPQQLIDRAVKGHDPVTGTKKDAYNKKPNGTAADHKFGRTASKFASKAALVKADEEIRKSDAFKKKVEEAKKTNAKVIAVTDTKLEALGKDYKKLVSGVTRQGPKDNPTGTTPTDFTDGTIRAVYKKDAAGNWNVETMFPEPKP